MARIRKRRTVSGRVITLIGAAMLIFAAPAGIIAAILGQSGALAVVFLVVAALLGTVGGYVMAFGLLRWAVTPGIEARLEALIEHEQAQLDLLDRIADRIRLSDTARRARYRQANIDALIEAAEMLIEAQDFSGAMSVLSELDERFGMRDRTQDLRQRIHDGRTMQRTQWMGDAESKLTRLIEQCQWDQARREAERMRRRYPDVTRFAELPGEIDQRRNQHKQQLREQFDLARQHDDLEQAFALLEKLELTLTEVEIEQIKEAARDVVTRYRRQLTDGFKTAVKEKRWEEAITVGQRITQHFSEARIAEEARGMMEQLHQRLEADKAAAEVG